MVFPLRDGEPAADAQPDVDVIDTPPPRCPDGNDAIRQILPAVADTIISSGAVTQNYGGLSVATISGDLGPTGSRGLFRFQLGVIAAADVLELRLVLPSAMTSGDCGTDCGACAGIEQIGTLHAFPANDAWVESQVTWTRASTALAWQLPGASGATDRGPEIVPAPDHEISADTTFVANPEAIAPTLAWITSGHLTFLVETTSAKQVVRTRENVCDGGASNAHLEVLGC